MSAHCMEGFQAHYIYQVRRCPKWGLGVETGLGWGWGRGMGGRGGGGARAQGVGRGADRWQRDAARGPGDGGG